MRNGKFPRALTEDGDENPIFRCNGTNAQVHLILEGFDLQQEET